MDEFNLAEPKSRFMIETLANLVGDATALILIPEKNAVAEGIMRSANNLSNAKTLMASYLNIRDLLGFDKVIMPLAALEVIESYLG